MRARLPAPAFSVTVHGIPAPQGSKDRLAHGAMVESSKKVKPWRQDVKHAALEVVGDDWTLLDGPLVASMVFALARPRSHYRTGRNAALLRDGAPDRPAGVPDLSKLARSTEDALTGVVWVDDARVVEYERLAKCYAAEDLHDGPRLPGCVIQVWPLSAIFCPHGWRVSDACGPCAFDAAIPRNSQ